MCNAGESPCALSRRKEKMSCLVRSQDDSFYPGFERTRVDPFEPCMKMI